jgi:hypothetical protein
VGCFTPPGRFYGDADVYPWLPNGFFVSVSNVQFNWVTAYSGSAVYVVLMSQSFDEEEVTCVLNDALVGNLTATSVSAVWRDNTASPPAAVPLNRTANGMAFTLAAVPAKGTVALKLAGAVATTRLHQSVLAPGLPPLSPLSRVVGDESGAFGVVSAVVLRWGVGMTELFAFSQANSTMWAATVAKDRAATSHIVFDQVALHWQTDAEQAERSVVGTIFPFDFSVPLLDSCKTVSFRFVGVSSTGATLNSRNYTIPVA